MLSQPKRAKAQWTPALEAQLRSLYPYNTAEICGEIMGMRIGQIYTKANSMGLEKSEDFKRSVKSGRVARGRQHPSMVASQFKPGIVPWNAGKHYMAGGRSTVTQFKKGRKPEDARNYLPIGTLRLSKDGYLVRKVTDDQKLFPARRWQFVHRLVWEAAHGPIPAGHMVVFRPGQFTNLVELLTADRLECISRAENAQRNNVWRKNPDLMRLYQLKGAITRQVNRIKESQHV